MYQVLRLMTLMNIKVGLTLRNFLNTEMNDFMIQLDINMLPTMFFTIDNTQSRDYSMFGIKSNLFILYMITAIIVIVMAAF